MRKAFTLIELLVVVSIIALLIAILQPVLSNTKYAANITKCQVAVRSIAAVQLSYAVDHKGYFPGAGYRWNNVNPYTGDYVANGGGWTDARDAGARVRPWELQGGLTGNGSFDLRPIYYDYMQNNSQNAVLHCPMASRLFLEDDNDDRILSYMLYTTNNYRSKHFYFEEIGAYERMDTTWSAEGEHGAEFTLLASDFAWGTKFYDTPADGATLSHPAPNGAIGEYKASTNSVGGYVVNETQYAPLNYADADGSVQTFKVSAATVNDTDNWVINRHHRGHDFMLPRELAR